MTEHGKKYNVFISYRRAGGKDYARILKPELEKRGLRVFLDFDELTDGRFDKRILDAIESSEVFLLVLSKDSLLRCSDMDDWVAKEIRYANFCGIHIVPVEFDKSFREMPEEVPVDIKTIVGQHQFSQIDTETLLQESVDKLVNKRLNLYITVQKESDAPVLADIHFDSDMECTVSIPGQEGKKVSPQKTTTFKLPRGRYKMTAVSVRYPDVYDVIVVDVPCVPYSDFVQVRLKEKVENYLKVSKDTERINKLKRDANAGMAYAQEQLADLYAGGNGVGKDTNLAISWYRKAIAGGKVTAYDKLNDLLNQFDQVALLKRANSGEAAAQLCLGIREYESNEHKTFAKDWNEFESFCFYETLDRDQMERNYDLYISKSSLANAYKWFCMASKSGYVPALFYKAEVLFNIGLQFKSGTAMRTAEKILVSAADQGYAPAQHAMVSLSYEDEKKVAWLEKAVKQDYAPAMVDLGKYYLEKKGNKALYWLEKAAKLGDFRAKEILDTL